MKKILFYGFSIVLVTAALFFLFGTKDARGHQLRLVEVIRGTIAEKALAVGTIEPEKEINVKSAISGIVSDVFFKVGDKIRRGEPLFKISPNPTPVDYAEARRNMEIAEVMMKQVRQERDRMLKLFKEKMISSAEMDALKSRYNEADLRFKIAREKFNLLEKGRIRMAGKSIDSVIKSPITGVVLTQNVSVGDPVVPLTNFQPGTELCAMADMGKMLFKGTVDEIDVGKLETEMPADINIGALPETKVDGQLLRISPKAKKQGNSTLFDIEVMIVRVDGKPMRAGYSATAYVKIREQKDVLVLPERLIIFEKDKRYVEIPDGENTKKVEVKTGLSDSLNIEVTEGLKLGDKVVERPPREIT